MKTKNKRNRTNKKVGRLNNKIASLTSEKKRERMKK
jgi:hypothetical protein